MKRFLAGLLVGIVISGIPIGADTNVAGDIYAKLTTLFVTRIDAVVDDGIRAEGGQWDITINGHNKAIATFDAVVFKEQTSLDDFEKVQGLTLFTSSPVVMHQWYDGSWHFQDMIAQADWVSGETITNCIRYDGGQWYAARIERY